MLLAWAVILCTAAAAVYAMAGDGKLLAEEMYRHAGPEETLLPASEYSGVGQMTAGFLKGKEETFQYSFSDENGSVYLCFRPNEAEHMADCRGLIALAGTLRLVFGGACLILAGAGILFRRCRAGFAQGVIHGLRAAGIIGAAVLVWALIDFDGLFTCFHRLAFRNEGWLLNPATDLLIRLMPTGFFVSLAVRGLIAVLAAALLADAAARLCLRAERKRGTETGNLS